MLINCVFPTVPSRGRFGKDRQPGYGSNRGGGRPGGRSGGDGMEHYIRGPGGDFRSGSGQRDEFGRRRDRERGPGLPLLSNANATPLPPRSSASSGEEGRGRGLSNRGASYSSTYLGVESPSQSSSTFASSQASFGGRSSLPSNPPFRRIARSAPESTPTTVASGAVASTGTRRPVTLEPGEIGSPPGPASSSSAPSVSLDKRSSREYDKV